MSTVSAIRSTITTIPAALHNAFHSDDASVEDLREVAALLESAGRQVLGTAEAWETAVRRSARLPLPVSPEGRAS